MEKDLARGERTSLTSDTPAGAPVGGRLARVLHPPLWWLLERVQDHWIELEVVHPERIATLPLPSLFIFNYQGPYAPLLILRALPPEVRARTTLAVDARIWQGRDRWQGILAGLVGHAFPFAKKGMAARAGLEMIRGYIERGYAVIMSPEGDPEVDGELLPFREGAGFIALKMGVPVVPFRLEGYHHLFPREVTFPYLPTRRGPTRLIVGEPIEIPPHLSRAEATALLRQALLDTR